MTVTGFTIIRNAILLDYPVVEAIKSILPLCDNFVVGVGASDDDTLELIRQIDPIKITILPTTWDLSLREGGKLLAVETNKVFQAIGSDADWCFYIQADETVHEKYHDNIRAGMLKWKDDKRVDGLLFNYLHFYGSYDYIANSPTWYNHEIRIIRNDKSIYSYRDAQGFRKGDNQKLNVKPLDAYIYHYGWVKQPKAMQQKQEQFHKMWHDDQWIEKHVAKATEFDYENHIDSLALFTGTHPAVIRPRIHAINWKFDYDISRNKLSLKKRLKNFARKKLGLDFSYKNYRVV
jgi:hypothetical protein